MVLFTINSSVTIFSATIEFIESLLLFRSRVLVKLGLVILEIVTLLNIQLPLIEAWELTKGKSLEE